jgi:hypothetical protein
MSKSWPKTWLTKCANCLKVTLLPRISTKDSNKIIRNNCRLNSIKRIMGNKVRKVNKWSIKYHQNKIKINHNSINIAINLTKKRDHLIRTLRSSLKINLNKIAIKIITINNRISINSNKSNNGAVTLKKNNISTTSKKGLFKRSVLSRGKVLISNNKISKMHHMQPLVQLTIQILSMLLINQITIERLHLIKSIKRTIIKRSRALLLQIMLKHKILNPWMEAVNTNKSNNNYNKRHKIQELQMSI